jgi:hypothetical protein
MTQVQTILLLLLLMILKSQSLVQDVSVAVMLNTLAQSLFCPLSLPKVTTILIGFLCKSDPVDLTLLISVWMCVVLGFGPQEVYHKIFSDTFR